jgi:hypothetical protein
MRPASQGYANKTYENTDKINKNLKTIKISKAMKPSGKQQKI